VTQSVVGRWRSGIISSCAFVTNGVHAFQISSVMASGSKNKLITFAGEESPDGWNLWAELKGLVPGITCRI
jgi:hypothetical protein